MHLLSQRCTNAQELPIIRAGARSELHSTRSILMNRRTLDSGLFAGWATGWRKSSSSFWEGLGLSILKATSGGFVRRCFEAMNDFGQGESSHGSVRHRVDYEELREQVGRSVRD